MASFFFAALEGRKPRSWMAVPASASCIWQAKSRIVYYRLTSQSITFSDRSITSPERDWGRPREKNMHS